MILLFLLTTIKWQVAYLPLNDTTFTLKLYLEIPPQVLRFVNLDSAKMAAYEIQMIVFDRRGNQITGDYWYREIERETTNFYDSISINIPQQAKKFNLKILDLQGTEILNVKENITLLSYLANIRSRVYDDTLFVTFTVMNKKDIAGSVTISFQNMEELRYLKTGVYDDTVSFYIALVPNGKYDLHLQVKKGNDVIETTTVPVEIARPFYLDEKTWHLKVSQLEYIATPNEMNQLKKAKVEERDSLWRAFWKQYDPTPNTDYNEKEAEYFERIAYAEEHFSFGDKGWRSDRGRIYVKFGPPDEIQSRPYELSTKPYEIWYYYRLNLKFIFYDRHGFGEYILINPQGDRI
ncbi:MAG: GWxTD domain-containing protein [candidate division WOR-3 bacterium]|nr:GWxTD domain-containing protein [candidate division WOR-3 bacterium]